MKFKNLNENNQFLQSKQEVKIWLDKMGVENYIINDDLTLTVDVNGSVDISTKNLTMFPVKFGKISGTFRCINNQLTTLIGAPQSVGGNFICANNRLTTLIGAPQSVGGNFICQNNKLSSLDGTPQIIGKYIDLSQNPRLDNLKGLEQTNIKEQHIKFENTRISREDMRYFIIKNYAASKLKFEEGGIQEVWWWSRISFNFKQLTQRI